MLDNLHPISTAGRVPHFSSRKLATRAPRVTGQFLQLVPTSFVEFINDPVCGPFIDRIVGERNDVSLLLSELRRLLSVFVASRVQLKRWVTETWLPNSIQPVKRGAAYWQRVTSIIWEIYESTCDLRHRTKRAIKKEVERLACADKRKRSKMLAARARRRVHKQHEVAERESTHA